MNRIRSVVLGMALGLCSCCAWADGPIRIVLERSFVDEFADRGLIEANFTIDAAHPKPNPPSKDGDLHIAGRAPEVGMACVAELMNARDETDELQLVHTRAGSGQTVRIAGAWRLWCEHAGTAKQEQQRGSIGTTAYTTTNPDHVFEIHPIVSMDDDNSATGWRPIQGFKTKEAHDAFVRYENLRCEINAGSDGKVELRTQMAGYNYVEFTLERDDPNMHTMADGSIAALCKIRDLDGDLLVRRCRVVFIKGTAPWEAIKASSDGARLHVLGLPRISLSLVKWRLEHHDDAQWKELDVLKWDLPYEIICAAVYPGGGENDDE